MGSGVSTAPGDSPYPPPARMEGVHEYMGSGASTGSGEVATPVLAHMDVGEPGRSVRVPAPDTKCNFYIEFYE